MLHRHVLPLLAIFGVGLALFSVYKAGQTPPDAKKNMAPTSRPRRFESQIAGAGLIEARMENIPIGSPTSGVVVKVDVKVGDTVKAGDPLFRLDDRSLKAELRVREAVLAQAQADLKRLENAPRPEDIPPAKATLEEAKAKLSDAESALARSQRLFDQHMLPAADYDRDRYTYMAARAAAERADADFRLLMAGTWKEEIEVARTTVMQAQADVERIKTELDRLIVRALTDGAVLQVNVRPGQFAAMAWREPMVVLGDVRQLNLRVDIDEHDLPYFKTNMEAVAFLRGQPDTPFRLQKLVKIEPYVIPKASLTGDNTERVDTRVLQVVYALPDKRPIPLYVGQQMDVYFGYPKSQKSTDPSGLAAKPAATRPAAALAR